MERLGRRPGVRPSAQLGEALREERALGVVRRQLDARARIPRAHRRAVPRAAAGPRAPSGRGGSASSAEVLEQLEAGFRAFGHRDRDRAVQLHDGRRLAPRELAVERGDLAPVGVLGRSACACRAAIAAWSWYGPGRRRRSARSRSATPRSIRSRSHASGPGPRAGRACRRRDPGLRARRLEQQERLAARAPRARRASARRGCRPGGSPPPSGRAASDRRRPSRCSPR